MEGTPTARYLAMVMISILPINAIIIELLQQISLMPTISKDSLNMSTVRRVIKPLQEHLVAKISELSNMKYSE